MIWLRTGFPRIRSDKQTKNSEESISEWLVQATKRGKRNRPTRKEQKKRKEEDTATCWKKRRKKENKKQKQTSNKKKEKKKKK